VTLDVRRNDRWIVLTTIAAPTEAVRRFAAIEGWSMVAVGDKKTPNNWRHPDVVFISRDEQETLSYQTVRYLPDNHYSRKTIGYLWAIEHGAHLIADVDDDNIPYPTWGTDVDDRPTEMITNGGPGGFVNIYRPFTGDTVWPRGLPLDEVRSAAGEVRASVEAPPVAIWQGLADEDPDVDAIYRLTVGGSVTFMARRPLFVRPRTWAQVNSQNTIWHRKAFQGLLLPTTVTFRYTDILRGYIAQALLWRKGHCLGICGPTVRQLRNVHSYMADFQDELPMYLSVRRVISILEKLSEAVTIVDVYRELLIHNIVEDRDIRLAEAWVADLLTLGVTEP
jgi:hypothetical protein